MTAETLKPFIPPTTDNFNANHSPGSRHQRNQSKVALGLSVVALLVVIGVIGVEVWNSYRIELLQTEVQNLNKMIEKLEKHLGINYFEDIKEFENEYNNALLPDGVDDDDDDEEDDDDDDDDSDGSLDGPKKAKVDKDPATTTDDDDDDDTLSKDNDDADEDTDADDDDEDEAYQNYDDLLEKFKSYDDDDLEEEDSDNSSNTSDDDNFYDDFEKFKDSKKKKQTRKPRAIQPSHNEIKLLENDDLKDSAEEMANKLNYDSIGSKGSGNRQIVRENAETLRSPLRPRITRKRKVFPLLKSGDSLISAKSLALTADSISDKPAAHFHLNRKIPDRQAAIRIDSYPGDMYIGHPSWSNELNLERFFKVDQGVLIVKEPGLYYVYAQVCYNNTHDQNGFVIFHGHKPFLQCLNTIPTNLPLKIHTCHTSGLIHLKANDSIHLRDFHADRNAVLRDTNNRSYFGLIKI